MKTVISTNQDIFYNLAWEEHILKEVHKDEDIFLLWKNTQCVVVGRNQNIYEELNLDYLHEHKIPIARRQSGGGTVYHDLGNICFTFISKNKDYINNYKLVLNKLIILINELGINARFEPKSHIKIGDDKISGNAQLIFGEKILHHGTLLFDTDLSKLKEVIKPVDLNILSNGVKSNRMQVANIKNFTNLTLTAFENYLLNGIVGLDNVIELSKKDLKKIDNLLNEKYLSFNWNIGESPKSRIKKELGDYKIDITLSYGIIEDCIIMHENTLAIGLATQMVGQQCMPKDLRFLIKKAPEVYQMLFK